MTIKSILNNLVEKGIIGAPQRDATQTFLENRPLSVHSELRLLLLTGITFFCSGLGMLIYKHIDTIGHQSIIALIALVTTASGAYAYRKRQPYTDDAIQQPNTFADYALLLSCMTFLILEGYLQYQYQIFGTRYGLATLIPTVLFFLAAYRFDHKGVLTMAMTALATWAGLTITPFDLLKNDFSNLHLVWAGIGIGTLLIAIGYFSEIKNLKPHFSYSYYMLGGNLAVIASLAGNFIHNKLFCLIMIALCIAFVLYARKTGSHLFLLMGVIYSYIGITYILIDKTNSGWFFIYYGLFSCLGVVLFLTYYKKILNLKS
jgi:Predicted membrane protein (DUF2157)